MDITHISNWQVVRDRQEFLNLEVEWRDLFDSNPGHSPFQSWSWVTSWLNHLAGAHELRIICGRKANGELTFVLPLVLRLSSRRVGSLGHFVVCGYGPECSDYVGCLWHPELADCHAEVTADAIERHTDGSKLTYLPSLDGVDDFPASLHRKLEELGRVVRIKQDNCCPTAKLPRSWDDYLKGLSSNFRSQVRRHHRRISEHPTIEFRSVGAPGAKKAVDDLIQLNRARMADKNKVSSLEDAGFRAFMADVVPKLIEENLAWLDVVTDGERIIGAALNLVYRDRVYYYMGGFDVDAGNFRPGTALFAEVIKRSIDQSYTSYDFLRGAELYKYRWGSVDVFTWQLTVYPQGIRGKISHRLDGLEQQARAMLRRLRDK